MKHAARTFALAVVVSLSACGGSSSGGGSSGPDEESGTDARVRLALNAPARQRLDVTTTSTQRVTVDGETRERTVVTGIDVDAILSERGESFRLDVLRELRSFSPEASRPPAFELARTSTLFNANGEALEFDDEVSIFDALALDAYHVVALTLSHPGTPVGVGDTWTERNALPSIRSTVVTRVEALDDRSITVSKRIDAGADSRERYSVTGEMTAVYALSSMLLRSADISLTVRYTDTLYVNGAPRSFEDSSIFSQAIREAST